MRALFGLLTFRIAVVFDVFSRLPLAFGVWPTEPSALGLVKLLERSMVFGKPKVLITDQGSVFTSDLLRAAVRTLGIEHRFGALYQHGSIARLERFWRSLRSLLYHHALFRRLVVRDLERDVQLALVHYSFFRPHSGLKRQSSMNSCAPGPVSLRFEALRKPITGPINVLNGGSDGQATRGCAPL